MNWDTSHKNPTNILTNYNFEGQREPLSSAGINEDEIGDDIESDDDEEDDAVDTMSQGKMETNYVKFPDIHILNYGLTEWVALLL